MSIKSISIVAAGAMLVAAVSPAAAAPGFVCDWYAGTAVWQQYFNVRKHCGYKGLRWHTWREAHYNWCLLQNTDVVYSETWRRDDDLMQCGIPIPADRKAPRVIPR